MGGGNVFSRCEQTVGPFARVTEEASVTYAQTLWGLVLFYLTPLREWVAVAELSNGAKSCNLFLPAVFF